MIRCKMRKCPYFDNRGICVNSRLALDEMGMCDIIWYQGMQKPKYINDQSLCYKREEVIIDVDFKTIEEEKEEAVDGLESPETRS